MDRDYWAKKRYGNAHPPTVAEHCRDVCQAADAIIASVGLTLGEGLGVAASCLSEIRPLLRTAALLHDLAKVNSAFQYMLRAKPGDPIRQPVRHEILGAWLLSDPNYLGRWFAGLRTDAEIWSTISAVAGHPLKMVDPARTSR